MSYPEQFLKDHKDLDGEIFVTVRLRGLVALVLAVLAIDLHMVVGGPKELLAQRE